MSTCDAFREALSAGLDDELRPLERAALDGHLATCRGCRTHGVELEALHRMTRVSEADAVPDLTHQILATHRVQSSQTLIESADWRRWALAVLGLTIGILSLPGLIGSDPGTAIHLSRELASWEFALAASLVLVAWQPRRAEGVLPLAGVVVGILVVTAVADALGGDVAAAGEAHHALEVLSVGILFSLARSNPSPAPAATAAA